MGIDIGTTSIKAVAVTADGTVVRRVRRPHTVRAPVPDIFEHDAKTVWSDGVAAVFAEMSDGLEIAGVTVSAMVPSLCGVDADERPVTPGLLYGDGRGRAPDVTGEVVGFARWLLAQPGVVALRPAQAVANVALCGVAAMDSSTAMTMMPLFDGRGWDASVCASLGVGTDVLPAVVPGAGSIGATAGGAAVSGGTIDALAEQFVADARRPGDVLVICGTTLITWALTDVWREVPGLWSIPWTEPGVFAIGGASNAGGLFIDRALALIADVDPSSQVDPPADDLPMWLPYLRGERTPLHDPARRGELFGLHVGHGPAAVRRAAYEAAGFVVRHHLELSGVVANRIVAVGGGTRSAPWMQAVADATNLPVDVSSVADGAALGAAAHSRITAGLAEDYRHAAIWAPIARRVEPRPDWVDGCNMRYARFLSGTRR